jgi:Xaa-Pro aminopeptidase
MITASLQSHDLAALACFSSAEVLMLTGYWPVMENSVAFATADGTVMGIAPEDEIELAHATSDVEFIPYRPASLEKIIDLTESLKAPLQQLTRHLKIGSGRITVNLSASRHPAAYQSVSHFRSSILPLLGNAYPRAQVVSCPDLFTELLSVKSEVELDHLRRASASAGAGFRKAAEVIAAGKTEYEVAADIEHAFSRSGHDGFERSKGYFFCMSGPNSFKAAGAYARTRSRVIEEGDFVMIHANTTGDGYWTDITRTYVVGQQSEMQEKMYAAVAEARAAALSAIRPGVKASEVDRAARSILDKRGFGPAFKHAVGHGVCFSAADNHARPRLHPHSTDILEAGMTFNIEPAIYLEHVGGLRHCDVVTCTEDGAEVLTDY